MLSTLEAIDRSPRDGGLVSNSLVYRYDVEKSADGLTGKEGTFSLCTFWLVEALTRAGRIDEARLIFEQMLSYANHLGLYAEEIGPSGEALGNFPQAFTHLTLISSAFNLDRVLGARRRCRRGREDTEPTSSGGERQRRPSLPENPHRHPGEALSTVPHPPKPGYIGQTVNARGFAYPAAVPCTHL